MATSIRLNTHRRTAVATATGLPRHARNDKMGTHETVPDRSACRSSPATIQPFPSVIPARGPIPVRRLPTVFPQYRIYWDRSGAVSGGPPTT